MTTPTTTATDATRERLRATVAAILADVYDRTTNPTDAETAIMEAAQQWVTEGYAINALPAAPCPGSGQTISRWYAPHGWSEGFNPTPEDPGPYTEGERVTCPRCSATVTAARTKTTPRETGTAYVAWLADH